MAPIAPITLRARLAAFALAAFAAVAVGTPLAHAAPQIVAVVPSNGEVELVCDGARCSAEFSTICLQQSRSTPSPGTPYVIHRPDRTAVAVTGYRAGGGTMALASGVLDVASLRGPIAFRFSVPAAFLKTHGLDRLTVNIESLAMLVPVAETGDSKPQTGADVTQASEQLKTTGAYWVELNPEKMAMARLTNRVINRLPARGTISEAANQSLWESAVAPEKELSEDALDWARRYVDYCWESPLSAGRFSMRRCLWTVHDSYMHDLNVKYWNNQKPQS